MSTKTLALYDPYHGGHHGLFIQHLIRYWGEHRLVGNLKIVVTRSYLETHRPVEMLVSSFPESDITIHPIDPLPPLPSASTRALVQNDMRQGRQVQQFLQEIHPSHVLFMYFDHIQISLATKLRFPFPLHLSGIYFRPSFHYPRLMKQSTSLTDKVKNLRKRLILKWALTNPHFKTLFSLDPYILPDVQQMNRKVVTVALPDGVEEDEKSSSPHNVPESWHIEPGRVIALSFGSIASRKGVFKTLDALLELDVSTQRKLAVVFAGLVVPSERERFYQAIEKVRAQSETQIIVNDWFIEDQKIPYLLRAADVVLVTYQHHIGSSNVLIRAARADVPVIGTDYGLVGAHIKNYGLGISIDSTNPSALAEAITRFVSTSTLSFDRERARAFGEENKASRYAETIFSNLGFV